MVNKKVLVCCGTGIATSVQVANKLQRMLRDRGVTATMKECKTANVSAQMTTFQPDAIVVTTACRGIPVTTAKERLAQSEIAKKVRSAREIFLYKL